MKQLLINIAALAYDERQCAISILKDALDWQEGATLPQDERKRTSLFGAIAKEIFTIEHIFFQLGSKNPEWCLMKHLLDCMPEGNNEQQTYLIALSELFDSNIPDIELAMRKYDCGVWSTAKLLRNIILNLNTFKSRAEGETK